MINPSLSIGDQLWNVVRNLRRAPERWLHPWRRARARARLRGAPPPKSVLVMCHGNICRSPYAAAALRKLLPSGTTTRIDSAGFIGAHRSSPPEAVDVAAARGVDLRRHRSRVVSAKSLAAAELVIVMEAQQAVALRRYGVPSRPVLILGDLDPVRPATRTIRDPVEQPRAVFADSYERIDRCLNALVEALAQPLK